MSEGRVRGWGKISAENEVGPNQEVEAWDGNQVRDRKPKKQLLDLVKRRLRVRQIKIRHVKIAEVQGHQRSHVVQMVTGARAPINVSNAGRIEVIGRVEKAPAKKRVGLYG